LSKDGGKVITSQVVHEEWNTVAPVCIKSSTGGRREGITMKRD